VTTTLNPSADPLSVPHPCWTMRTPVVRTPMQQMLIGPSRSLARCARRERGHP